MTPAQWGSIRRLAESEKLSAREIARRLGCSRDTVQQALAMPEPPGAQPLSVRGSKLDPYKPKIVELLAQHADLSGERVLEELRKAGYLGGRSILNDYLRSQRPGPVRVYQEVDWQPGEAMQVDWGDVGWITIGNARRRVSVFVGVLCYSRMLHIVFTLDQKKETFYDAIAQALSAFGGSPRRLIVDNLKAAVSDGHGRHARFHRDFLDLCGHFRMEAVACARRDPESKGIVEGAVRYVKQNALAGRDLMRWDDYANLARDWLRRVNGRTHRTTGTIPRERLAAEHLRPLPAVAYDGRMTVSCPVNSHACITFDGNRYSVPPDQIGRMLVLKADAASIRIFWQEREVAYHQRSYEKGRLIQSDAHRQAALAMRKRQDRHVIEARFLALGPVATTFRDGLMRRQVKAVLHMRKIVHLANLYGKAWILQAMEQTCAYGVCDAAYVENLIHQARRKAALPVPLPLTPKRKELLEEDHMETPDPGLYDRLCEEGEHET